MASSSMAIVPISGKRKAPGSSAAGVVCPICGDTFKTRTVLKKHTERKHSEERDHVCSKCNFASKTKADNAQHESTCLNGTDKGKVLRCTVCRMELVSVEQWKKHKTFTRHKGYDIVWPRGPEELGRVLDAVYARSEQSDAQVVRVVRLADHHVEHADELD